MFFLSLKYFILRTQHFMCGTMLNYIICRDYICRPNDLLPLSCDLCPIFVFCVFETVLQCILSPLPDSPVKWSHACVYMTQWTQTHTNNRLTAYTNQSHDQIVFGLLVIVSFFSVPFKYHTQTHINSYWPWYNIGNAY